MDSNRALQLYTHALECGRASQAEQGSASESVPSGDGQVVGVAESATELQQRLQLKVGAVEPG